MLANRHVSTIVEDAERQDEGITRWGFLASLMSSKFMLAIRKHADIGLDKVDERVGVQRVYNAKSPVGIDKFVSDTGR